MTNLFPVLAERPKHDLAPATFVCVSAGRQFVPEQSQRVFVIVGAVDEPCAVRRQGGDGADGVCEVSHGDRQTQ